MPTLRIEEYRDGNVLTLKAEIPGIDPDKDVKITVNDGRLRIQAERRMETEHVDKEGYRSEFRYGSFVRDYPLPLGCERSDIKAAYHDGVLQVRIPIPDDEKAVTTIAVSHD